MNKRYCSEDISLIENYEKAKADNFKGWCIHHRLETHNFDGTKRKRDLSIEDLIALDMYIYRPANELIFMRIEDHMSLHHKGRRPGNYGKQHSEETKRKMSEAWDYDKHFTEETRRKMSEANKGEKNGFYGKKHSEEARRKMSKSHKVHWKLVDGKRVWY